MLFNLRISYNLYLVNGYKYMLVIKRTTVLPINCYYGISILAKNEAVMLLIPRCTVFSVYSPTLAIIVLHLRTYTVNLQSMH